MPTVSLQHLQTVFAGPGLEELIALVFEDHLQGLADVLLVVDDQDPGLPLGSHLLASSPLDNNILLPSGAKHGSDGDCPVSGRILTEDRPQTGLPPEDGTDRSGGLEGPRPLC